MKKEDILEKAKYILFPYMNKIYDESYLSLVNSTIIKLPIIKDDNNDIMYDKMPTNKHHYTMYYHINYVIPVKFLKTNRFNTVTIQKFIN